MLAARSGPRTSSHTLAAWLARYTAACPAEFPAPTNATFLSAAKLCLQRRCPIVHARALECFQTIDGEPPVTRAGGNHDRARHGPLAVRKLEHKGRVPGTARWIELDCLVGYRHLDS